MMSLRSPILGGCLGLFAILLAAPAGAASSTEALRIARDSQSRWSIGTVGLREKHGGVRVRAELVVDGLVIAHLRLDPKTGTFVGDKMYAGRGAEADIARLKAAAARALPQVEVAGWAWPAEHGGAWRVALRYGGRVIGTVTVDVQRNRLVGHDERDDSEGE